MERITYTPSIYKIMKMAKKRTLVVEKELFDNVGNDKCNLYITEAIKESENAMCFDMGDLEDLHSMQSIDSLIKLPYATCWFEGSMTYEDGSKGYMAMLAVTGEEGHCQGHVFARAESGLNQWTLAGYGWVGGIPSVVCPSEYDPVGMPVADSINYFLCAVASFLSAINCVNVIKVEHKPPENKQKLQAIKGKKPLFSYWTLEIKSDRPTDKTDNGGTHASPRVHLRRGHARQFKPGKFTWVQPCVVGKATNGIVHKDYALH